MMGWEAVLNLYLAGTIGWLSHCVVQNGRKTSVSFRV